VSQPASGANGVNPIHAPLPRVRELVPRALRWAAAAAVLGCLLYALLLVVSWQFSERAASEPFPVAALAGRAAVGFVVLLAVFFAARLVWLSRILADHAFAVLGFLATCFGLVMLAVFFASLFTDTVHWYQMTQEFIAANNEKQRQFLATYDPHKEVEAGLAYYRDLREQELKKAATKEEREKIEARYAKLIAFKRGNLETTAQEKIESARQGIREDASFWSVLTNFLTGYPSSEDEPQNAGIYPALVGSLLLALITMLFAVPVGVGAALYLEEYRSKSWFGNLIQVNINNLAGVPSVVYGILGAFVFVSMFRQLEQVNPAIAARNLLGGGLTLGLLTLPIVIVAAQEAIRAVPKSIREGAYALGATQWQVIRRNVLPMASPGILTGTILAVSRAIGEAAPLVMFGALLDVTQAPGLFNRFTAMPLQIFAWAERPPIHGAEAWQYNAAVTSLLLMILLLGLNAVAIVLRNRAQRHMRY
jgi:phosphate transport system permease protein